MPGTSSAKKRGRFITIEGGDGSGKGTQARLLVDWLREQGKDVLELDFPQYDQPSALYATRYLNGEYGGANDVPADLASLTYAIDRFSTKQKVDDFLQKPDGIVIANRYVASNMAHQGTKFDDFTRRRQFYDEIMHLEYEILGIARPDINIVLLVPSAISQANVDKKDTRSYTDKKRDIHEADADHLEKAKRNYEELCQLYPDEFTPIECMVGDRLRAINNIQTEIQQRLKP